MDTSLSGKTYVVTGATSGIGLATAEALVRQGALVIGVGRSLQRCRETEQRLRSINTEAEVAFACADLSMQLQVRSLAGQIHGILQTRGKTYLDGLVNNAGTFAYWLTLTPEGFEMQWAVNHLAPFLLTHELLPLLHAAPTARVVTVSSGSHYGAHLNWKDLQLRRHYNGLRAYGQTKLANVLFTLELNQRLGANSTVRAFAADPGLVYTDMGMKGTPAIVGWIWRRRRSSGISAAESARGIVTLLTEPGITDRPEIYWLHGKPKTPSSQARDQEASRMLWEISEQMCGLAQELQHA